MNDTGYSAEVVEWQTRTFEGRVGKPVRVQIPPSAPTFHPMSDWTLKLNAVAAGVVVAFGFTMALRGFSMSPFLLLMILILQSP